MPPKIKITKDDIVKTAVSLVRENGTDAINARAIAAALGCSTQPIFSNFADMDELFNEALHSAYRIYLAFLENEAKSEKHPRYKSFGMAYIKFAAEEKELFKLLFMRDRTGEAFTVTADFEESVQIIMKSCNLSYEKATLMHMELWSCVHGIAVMLATSFLTFDWKTVSDMISDIYFGVRERHLSKEKDNGSN